MFLLVWSVRFSLFVIQLGIVACSSVFPAETGYTSGSPQCEWGNLVLVDTCVHHGFHYNFVLNLTPALILHTCPHLPFFSYRPLSNLPLSFPLQVFLPSLPQWFPQSFAFLLSLFPFLIVRDIFYISFCTARFSFSPLLPMLLFRALLPRLPTNFPPITQFVCSHLTPHTYPAQPPI